MSRVRLPYRPRWEGAIHGYTVNALRRAWPGLSAFYEFDDLLQEAQLVFLTCARRYCRPEHAPGRRVRLVPRGGWGWCDDPRWFMCLYKTALRNKLCDLYKAVRPYSLMDATASASFEVPVLDLGVELLGIGEDLSDDLKLILRDLIRPKSKLQVSRAMRAALARAMLGQ